jgi:type 1 fimbria pilin
MRLRNISVLMLALLLVAAVPVWAQTVTGSIAGTVTDPSGAVVPGAKITITDVEKKVVMRTMTTGGGKSAASLPTRIQAATCRTGR